MRKLFHFRWGLAVFFGAFIAVRYLISQYSGTTLDHLIWRGHFNDCVDVLVCTFAASLAFIPFLPLNGEFPYRKVMVKVGFLFFCGGCALKWLSLYFPRFGTFDSLDFLCFGMSYGFVLAILLADYFLERRFSK